MPLGPDRSLRGLLGTGGQATGAFLHSADATVKLARLAAGTSLDSGLDVLRGKSVAVATRNQLTACLSLIELDGVARRMVLLPPDSRPEHLPGIMALAEVDVVVHDEDRPPSLPTGALAVRCRPAIHPVAGLAPAVETTEWVLLTSGTTGQPKLVSHTLASLAGAIRRDAAPESGIVWSTFYDIRRYGGLQIFLRAMLGGTSLVLSSAGEQVGEFLLRAGACGVTHISGTPSHWRRAVLSAQARRMRPRYIRLSGEIADAAILAQLRATYPDARIAHAFASTEAGVGFTVEDGQPGFPASLVAQGAGAVELRVQDGTLRLRSARTASGYLGARPVADADGFVDTGDLLELVGDRYHFVGRRDGVINVGGLKVHPETVEAVINGYPRIRMSLAKARRSPFTGAVVVADVVADMVEETASGGKPATDETAQLKAALLAHCRGALAPHAVPASIRFVASLPVTPAGKLARAGA